MCSSDLRLIAPAVAVIAAGGLALSWLSGAALEALRADGRAHKARSIAHVVVCLAGVIGWCTWRSPGRI